MSTEIFIVTKLSRQEGLERARTEISAAGMTPVVITQSGMGDTGGLLAYCQRRALSLFKGLNGIESDEVSRHGDGPTWPREIDSLARNHIF